jgi:hypothetical protein
VVQTTITTTFKGRIVANASLWVGRQSGNGDVVCRLWIGPPGAFSPSTFTRISNPGGGGAAFPSLTGQVYQVTIPLTGAAIEPAGTYAIQATCETGSTAASFFDGDITAVAAAQ